MSSLREINAVYLIPPKFHLYHDEPLYSYISVLSSPSAYERVTTIPLFHKYRCGESKHVKTIDSTMHRQNSRKDEKKYAWNLVAGDFDATSKEVDKLEAEPGIFQVRDKQGNSPAYGVLDEGLHRVSEQERQDY